jgi:formyltetrahydrofolate deformylase
MKFYDKEQFQRSAILLTSCPDREGLVAAITSFIAENHGNILHLDQHVDTEANVFFMRVEWDLAHFKIAPQAIKGAFSGLAQHFGMTWDIHFSSKTPKMAIFVSKEAHCLYDILSRWQAGEWQVEIPLILSNHPDLGEVAQHFGISFQHTPITKETKAEVEAQQLALLAEQQPDFIVLARYMQIITGEFIRHYPHRIINIHHSFLPAFIGAKPYHAAYGRGVKIIGATSHYVTEDLDAGPIIEQDVVRISHKESVKDLVRKGKDLEKIVLARAIHYHLRNQILVYNNKTVIFG